ncbi:peptide/nickel transport system ATP-binding protein/oligopeptide transport system ATP-binding protein [Salana multivorans]|uniref:Peptide/nickel transport system ATP-binding protein/oligopeptide transport system ATP-binding protein n=1 Tax=Salana multivorans TaxID=120377 RepID=A0A3N2DD84_9MICO|nr:ABC transporter ATP-binding protein [Salana multivorans]ROR97751.1 peptide/nickel transport system ATP-binding protein/oligopeptide transport system ATP-binding protein [Salana multivorans]
MSVTTTEPVLDVRGLKVEFRGLRQSLYAVNGVDLQIGRGQSLGLVGESGCGKSTAVRAMLGLIRPPGVITGGESEFQGRDLVALTPGRRRRVLGKDIGFITQNPFRVLNPVLSVYQQFRRMLRAHGLRLSKTESWDLASRALLDVGLRDPERVLSGYAHQLSGGMAQRVCIAMSTLLEPELVIADEPTTALDVTVQQEILDLLRERTSRGATIIVTHDLSVVAQYCDRVAVMYAGVIVEQGTTFDVFTNPTHPYTKALLASVPRRGAELYELGGAVESLFAPPTHCTFANRCAFAREVCRREVPRLEPIGVSDHRRACFVPVEEVVA